MPKYDLRILLETVGGAKSSYITQSFVNTDKVLTSGQTELVLSASQVYNRITGSVSCSYQNNIFFSQSSQPTSGSGGDFNPSFTFKDNTLLSASLTGSLNTGSVVFTSTNNDYDRLLKYKFIGEKVCNVLGLPSSQWIYVDQVRLPVDDESNFIEGNIRSENIFVGDQITFANNSTVNSDLTVQIDTGSDRHIKFIDTTGIPRTPVIFGYDADANLYELTSEDTDTFDITIGTGSIKILSGSVDVDGDIIAHNYIVSSSVTHIITQNLSGSTIFGDTPDDIHEFTGSAVITGSLEVISGSISSSAQIYSDTGFKVGSNGFITASIHGIHIPSGHRIYGDDSDNLYIQSIGRFTTEATNEVNINSDQNITLDSEKTIELQGATGITLSAPVTASSTISSSGAITGSGISSSGQVYVGSTLHAPNIGTGVDNSIVILDSDGLLKTDEVVGTNIWSAQNFISDGGGDLTNNKIPFVSDGSGFLLDNSNITNNTTNKGITVVGAITASGDISSSGTIYASNFESVGASGETINFNDNLVIVGNISSSGDISSSLNSKLSMGSGSFVGPVGIGTSVPKTPLHIKSVGESDGGLRFENTHDTVNMFFVGDDNDEGFQITYVGTGGAEIELKADGDLLLNASNGDNVAIGNSSPGAKLDITGDLRTSTNITASGNISSSGTIFANDISASGVIKGVGGISGSNGTFTGNVSTAGGLTVGDSGADTLTSRGITHLATLGNSAQNVAIGHTNPTLGKLHISGSGTNSHYSILTQTTGSINYMKFANSSTGVTSGDGFDIGANGTAAYLLQRENAVMIFSTNNTEQMRLLANGNLGIGATAAGEKLVVEGNISSSGKITADDFEFNLPTDNGRKFKGLTNRGVRIEKASTGGWAMEYGFVGNTERDLGGFGGLGGAGLTRFYIGGHYTTPIISIQSGSANTNGMIIGDNVKATLPAATLHISGGLFLDGGGTAGGHITASGNISGSLTSNLTIGGIANVNQVSASNGIVVDNNISASGNLEIAGIINGTQVSASNGIIVDSNISGSGNLEMAGSITATSADINGAVDIDGGNLTVGTALQLTNGGVFNFGSSFADGTLTWGNYYASLYGQADNKLRLGSFNQQGVLTISSSTENVMVISASNVGIGTNSPGYALEVVGSVSSSATLISKNINVAEKIIHLGDANTEIAFEPDKVIHTVGGLDMITLTEDTSDQIVFGDARTKFAGHITASGDISSSGNVTAASMSIGGANFEKHLTVEGDMSASGFVKASQGLINMVANNTNGILINNVDGEEQFAFFVDSNQHSDLYLYKDGTQKVRFGTYWPSSIDNDFYETNGGLILGSDTTTGNNKYGIYVSGGPDSGSAYFDENVKLGDAGTIATSSIHIANAQGDVDAAFRGSMLTLTPNSLINDDGFTGITMETSTNVNGYGISMGARRYTSDGKPAFVLHTHNNNLAGTERFRIQQDGLISFVGNITASGNISGSLTSNLTIGGIANVNQLSASNGIVVDNNISASGNLEIAGIINGTQISASNGIVVDNNISASGDLHITDIVSTDITSSGAISASIIRAVEIRDHANGHLTLRPDADLNLGTAGTDEINIGRTDSATCDLQVFAGDSTPTLRIVNQQAIFAGHITASSDISASGTITADNYGGNISGSLTSTGSFGSLIVPDKVQGNLTIDGILFATRKSFLINTPTGGKLEYGALEGQQNDVFFRGELKDDNVIHLPKEWEWLVDKDTITVQLTSIGKHQDLYIKEIKDNKIFIGINGIFNTKENIHCYHIVYATRKDVELIRNLQ